MAASLNTVTLIGHLGADPDVRNTQSGLTVASLSLATNERVKKGDGWEDHTEWHRISCFDKVADRCGEYLRKGSQVCVQGKLRTRKWQDKDGVDRWTTEIVAYQVLFLSSTEQGSGNSTRPPHPSKASAPAAKDAPSAQNDPDDFPF